MAGQRAPLDLVEEGGELGRAAQGRRQLDVGGQRRVGDLRRPGRRGAPRQQPGLPGRVEGAFDIAGAPVEHGQIGEQGRPPGRIGMGAQEIDDRLDRFDVRRRAIGVEDRRQLPRLFGSRRSQRRQRLGEGAPRLDRIDLERRTGSGHAACCSGQDDRGHDGSIRHTAPLCQRPSHHFSSPISALALLIRSASRRRRECPMEIWRCDHRRRRHRPLVSRPGRRLPCGGCVGRRGPGGRG